jgi:hypothetical protein
MKNSWLRALATLATTAALATGCSASPSGTSAGSPLSDGGSDAGTLDPNGGIGPDGRILTRCQAFPLKGLQFSPGGTVLPNKCAPFDPGTNNPYAVRCIDAMPSFKTTFAGDDLCILPPAPDKGIQVGLHPQGADYWKQMWSGDYSGYDKPEAVWILQPGQEITQNYVSNVSDPDPHDYYREYFRLRTGSHHDIITLNNNTGGVPDGWVALAAGEEAAPPIVGSNIGPSVGVIGGSQRTEDQNPATLDKPKEDKGYYLKWPANSAVVFNIHHINAGPTPLLREAWVNIWWESDATILESWYMGLPLSQPMTLDIAPGTVADLHYSWTIAEGGPVRIIRAFGHRHFWDTNFSSWIERSGDAGGAPELIYQSFNWQDMPTYSYNSEIMNPKANASSGADGAASGMVKVSPGDKLHFNCHIEYTEAHAATDPSAPNPAANGPLHFANETFKAEMCIMFGNSTSTLGYPVVDTTPLPSFATK